MGVDVDHAPRNRSRTHRKRRHVHKSRDRPDCVASLGGFCPKTHEYHRGLHRDGTTLLVSLYRFTAHELKGLLNWAACDSWESLAVV